jgi:hypothetical protein
MNCPHWLLALTIPFSRSDRAHTEYCRCWCRVFQRTVPDGLLRRRVSFGCRMDQGRSVRRESHVTRHAKCRQRDRLERFRPHRPVPARGRSPSPGTMLAGDPPNAADARRPESPSWPPRQPGIPRTAAPPARTFAGSRTDTDRWHAAIHPDLRMPPGARSQLAFRPALRHEGAPGDVLRRLSCLDLPLVMPTACVNSARNSAAALLRMCERSAKPARGRFSAHNPWSQRSLRTSPGRRVTPPGPAGPPGRRPDRDRVDRNGT